MIIDVEPVVTVLFDHKVVTFVNVRVSVEVKLELREVYVVVLVVVSEKVEEVVICSGPIVATAREPT